ncbi:MAG: pyrroline-5-carboxylate reductase [Rhodanobacter sp.]|jgi:pyrroline-5-carboxylate reductase
MTRIAFIGGGNMARSLIRGLLRTGWVADAITVSEPGEEPRESLRSEFGIACHAESWLAADNADVLLLAVKPQIMLSVREDLCDTLQRNRPLLISIAAGVRIDQLERWFGDDLPVVRCMPNIPASIGVGATAMCGNHRVSTAQRAHAQHILSAVGLTCWVEDETQMDTITALSGSGPAYFFAFVEALVDAAVAQGLPRDVASALAVQTCLGAGRMLAESQETPSALRRRVTSPNGTTQAALESFTTDGLSRITASAMAAATRRSMELANELDCWHVAST